MRKNVIWKFCSWSCGILALLLAFFLGSSIALADETIVFSATSNGGGALFGRTSDISYYANSFVPTDDVLTAQVNTAISYYDGGANIHDIGVVILGDTAGSPNTTVYGSTTISGASLTTGACAVPASDISTSEFSAVLTGGTTYWVKLQRLGAYQSPNYNPAICTQSAGGSGVLKYTIDNTTWSDYGPSYGMYGSIDLFGEQPASMTLLTELDNFASTTANATNIQTLVLLIIGAVFVTIVSGVITYRLIYV